MARRGKRYNGTRKKQITIPLAVVAGFAPMLVKTWEAKGQGVSGMARTLGRVTTGFDFWNGTFNFADMRYGFLPALAGVGVHWIANKTGINRAIARTGIPFIRL